MLDSHLSPNHESRRLYCGAPKESLPSYLQTRLREFFERAEALHWEKVGRGLVPTWMVSIEPTPQRSSGAYEWVDVVVDHPDGEVEHPRTFSPEGYGYCDGTVEYRVRVIDRRNRNVDCALSSELLSFLRRDEKLFDGGYSEEVAHMMSYNIERVYRDL